LLVLIRLGFVRLAGTVLSIVLWVAFTVPMFSFGGMHDSAVTGYFVVIIMAGVVAGGRVLLLITLLSAGAITAAYFAENMGLIEANIPQPSEMNDLILVVLMLGIASVLLSYAVRRLENVYRRARSDAQTLEESNLELQTSRDMLAARTAEMERRTRQLEATTLVAQESASMLDPQQLLSETVNLISEQFGFYHTGIFLKDPEGEWSVLQAASSEGGQRMLRRGHRLEMGVGIVGSVTASGEYRIASDVGTDAVYFDNPDLPDTRSEMAVPLRARGEVIGALDVQSMEPAAFDQEDVAALQTLADQVAVAISNARLFQRVQESLEAERRAFGDLSRAAWQQLVRTQSHLGLVRDEGGIISADDTWQPDVLKAMETGQVTPGLDEGTNVVVPIKVRGQVIGAVDAYKPDDAPAWSSQQIALLETLSEQLGDALEDARLYQDAQQRAMREALIGEVTSRMRETLDMDTILKTAAREMHRVLDLAEVEVRIGAGPTGSHGAASVSGVGPTV
jgi:GAF domain-containing protein